MSSKPVGKSAPAPEVAPGESTGSRRQRAQATAEQLLVAAREVFETQGYKATTVAGITAKAGCAHGTFYLYFQNKEDAFAKVMTSVVKEMEEASRASWTGDIAESLQRSIEGHFLVVQRHRGLWRCLMEGFLQSPSIQTMWIDLRQPFVLRLEAVLAALAAEGEGPAAPPQATALALLNMVEWTAFTVLELSHPTPDELAAAVQAVTELWRRGVYLDRA